MTWPVKDLVAWYEYLPPGDTARRNHDNCSSGRDVRKRLYVTKSDDNTKLKCFCHNCGQGTVINIRGGIPLRPVVAKAEEEGPPVLPPRWREGTALHPRHKMWLKAYGILAHAEEREVYSMSEHELVFPVIQDDHLQGYQIRYFDGRKPKWYNKGDVMVWWGSEHMAFYVEDIVSAYKLHEATGYGYRSLAGHRGSIKDKMYLGPPVVWLDNDKESVVEASIELIKDLTTPFYKYGVLIEGGTDPKRYSKAELQKVSDVCFKLLQSAPPDGGCYHVLKILQPGQGVCAGLGIESDTTGLQSIL